MVHICMYHTCQVAGAKMREISGSSRGVPPLGGDGCEVSGQKRGSLLRKEGDLASMVCTMYVRTSRLISDLAN